MICDIIDLTNIRAVKGVIHIENTFTYQKQLPSLPIPALEDTRFKLLEWIEPHVSDAQLIETERAIEEFFQENGEAEKLQQKLCEWDESREGSWLKPFWDDLYLSYRRPLPTGVNFNILLENQYQDRYTTSELAGKICSLTAELYHQIIDEKVPPAKMKGKPLDMSQYKKFFRSSRIPKQEKDIFHIAPFDKKNNHVALLYNHNVYKVDVTDSTGAIYQSRDIAAAIENAVSQADKQGENVGIFTAAEREKAAALYDQLLDTEANADILKMIEDALIVISIDEESETSEEAIQNLMLGCGNKYYDKTIQAVITKNGEIGYSIEHSSVDGTTIFTVISHVNEGLRNQEEELGYTVENPTVEKQEWQLSKEINSLLAGMRQDHAQMRQDFHIKSKTFDAFGSEEIKQMNLSPNAFFHLALQVAQYRTFGELHSVYEPVLTRFFYEGRTECARSTSREKLNFVYELEAGGDNETLYSLMQEASDAHSLRILACQKGLGVERHMYGLEQIYYMYGQSLGIERLPAIFSDKGYLAMRHDFISTSGMAYDNVKYRIFGPIVKDGFGLAYILLNDSISINVSCKTAESGKAKVFIDHLFKALIELRQITKSV
jgi:carnitine O-acetyltransferase